MGSSEARDQEPKGRVGVATEAKEEASVRRKSRRFMRGV